MDEHAQRQAPGAQYVSEGRNAAVAGDGAPLERDLFLLAASFFSGYAALAYEMSWTRIATYLVGSDARALGAVLGVFSASLAVGAIAGGRRLGAWRPSRAYAAVEGATAAVGALQCFVWTHHREEAAAFLSRVGAASPVAAVAACAIGLVAVPGVLMGMTLPLLVRVLTRPSAVRDAYASNALGAFVGALTVGGLVLPWASVSAGFLLAAACNVFAAGATVFAGQDVAVAPRDTARKDAVPGWSRPALCAFVAGIASFAFEVLLFRLLRTRLGSGSTDWTVALLIGNFLLGLAVGGASFERSVGAGRVELGTALALPFVTVVGMLALFTTGVPEKISAVSTTFGVMQTIVLGLIVVPIAAPFGFLFPYLVSREEELGHLERGRATSRILLYNSVGNLCGSVAAGFVLAPYFGSLRGLAVPVAALGLVILLLPKAELHRSRFAVKVFGAVALVGTLVMPAWLVQPASRRSFLLASREDAFGVYSVARARSPGLRLFRYGQPVSATFGEQRDNTHLAFDVIEQMGKSRSRIVAAGLGGACHLREGIARSREKPELFQNLGVVEISTAVLELARAQYGLPDSAFSRVTLGDFRAQLRLKSADVYYIDLLSPAVEGSGYSFTREFQEEVRASLSPDGMLVQWFGRFAVMDFLAEITRTMDAVYGGGFVLRTAAGHYLFVGMKNPANDARLEAALAELLERARSGQSLPFEFWSTKTVLDRLGVNDPAIVTEDAIPFGRLFVGMDRRPALSRERKLRGLAEADLQ